MFQRLKTKRHYILLAFILLLTAFLTIWKIWEEGNANSYYTAAVASMLQSWHNFFFASFDPGGYISVDKPALGLWLQAASGLIFGVHGWSMILPEALCAVGSVSVLYHIVQRTFGKAAGLAAALALALTPIFIAVSRTNDLDSSLVLVMLLAAWAVQAAAERGSLRLLLLSMALIGIGFNIKMLQAYMALPALMAVYFFTARVRMGKRLAHLAAATAVLLAVSLSWAVAVDATPAANRPYVGSSSTNSVLELALGYNGIQRVLPNGSPGGMGGNGMQQPGGAGGPGGSQQPPQGGIPPQGGQGNPPQGGQNGQGQPPQGGNSPGAGTGGGIGMNEGGSAGVLRLFNENMAGQISWLIPMAFLGILALALGLRRKDGDGSIGTLRHLLLWASWILPMMAYFSISGFFHRYYLCVLAPGLAALSGIGAVQLWKYYREKSWKAWLLPASIVSTAAVQCIIISRYTAWSAVLTPIVCAVAGLAAAALAVNLLIRSRLLPRVSSATAAAGLAALLIAPAVWSCTPILFGSQTALPIAGPELQTGGRGQFGGGGMPQGGNAPKDSGSSSQLVAFLLKNNTGEKYILAVPDANTAAPIILATGKAVMAVGGFSGSDKALTVTRLEQMVKNGELRYFMTGGRSGQQSEIESWVQQHGKAVDTSQWGGSISDGRGGPGGSSGTLYDLGSSQ